MIRSDEMIWSGQALLWLILYIYYKVMHDEHESRLPMWNLEESQSSFECQKLKLRTSPPSDIQLEICCIVLHHGTGAADALNGYRADADTNLRYIWPS